MDKPKSVGFALLELNKFYMYETYYDNLQPCFGQENFQSHYVDTDGNVISTNTEDIIKDLKYLEVLFEFSSLNKKNELFSFQKEKVIGKFILETPKNNWIDKFICLRSKA